MTSQKDKNLNFWNNINTEHNLSPDDEETINQLLVNTDFDELDLPEIAMHQDLFTEKGQWVEINTIDDFHSPTLPIAPLVNNTPLTNTNNAVEIDHSVMPPISRPEDNISPKPTQTVLESNSPQQRLDTLHLSQGLNTNAPHSTYIDTAIALSPLTTTFVAPITAQDSKDKYDKPLTQALENDDDTGVIGHQNYLVQRSPNIEPLEASNGNDKYDKAITITPLSIQEPDHLPETTTSLVENITKTQNTANITDFNLANANSNNTASKPTKNSLGNPNKDADKPIQPSGTNTSPVKEAITDSEWAIFVAEQEKTQQQLTIRISKVEKQLRTALLFSLVAAILAGVSIIAVVSGLI